MRRWKNGLAYMQERARLQTRFEGAALEGELRALREEYFAHEAPTIEAEERDGFFRFERPRIDGRNQGREGGAGASAAGGTLPEVLPGSRRDGRDELRLRVRIRDAIPVVALRQAELELLRTRAPPPDAAIR